jgi:hypothetical protein
MENLLQDIGVHFNKGNLVFANDMLAKNPKVFLFKSGGRRPPRHIHNPIELMFFTRWSGQRIDTGLIFFRKVRPGSQQDMGAANKRSPTERSPFRRTCEDLHVILRFRVFCQICILNPLIMGADSSLRADEVELLEKLEAKHRRPAEQSPIQAADDVQVGS